MYVKIENNRVVAMCSDEQPWTNAYAENTEMGDAYHDGALHKFPYDRQKIGQYDYDLAQGWIVNDTAAWEAVRKERDGLLAACDWTMVADAPTDKAAWGAYRQALRDLPETQPDPLNIVWPVPPA